LGDGVQQNMPGAIVMIRQDTAFIVFTTIFMVCNRFVAVVAFWFVGGDSGLAEDEEFAGTAALIALFCFA
jgi:hypothetical protein